MSLQSCLTTALILLGSFTLVRFLVKTAYALTGIFVLKGESLRKFGAGDGAWAVVTGATSGIGREFASQLAQAGFNLILVSRSPSLLKAASEEIASSTPRKVLIKNITIDLSSNDVIGFNTLERTIEQLDVGVLVNNAGRSHEMPVDFVETIPDEMDAILAININAVLRITSIVLPGMVFRKRGLILNMGSFAGAIPSPMLATYSGSKAFLSTWSSAIGEELKPYGVVVQHLNTYFVVSNMSKIRRPSAMVPTPVQYVRSVLSKIGIPCGAAFTGRPHTSTPFWTHAILDWANNMLGAKAAVVKYTHRLHKDIRMRALRKRASQIKRSD